MCVDGGGWHVTCRICSLISEGRFDGLSFVRSVVVPVPGIWVGGRFEVGLWRCSTNSVSPLLLVVLLSARFGRDRSTIPPFSVQSTLMSCLVRLRDGALKNITEVS